MSLSEIDPSGAISELLEPRRGGAHQQKNRGSITIRLKMDRTLGAAGSGDEGHRRVFAAMIESSRRAIIACQPYTMFSLPKYEIWKGFDDFDPVKCSAADIVSESEIVFR